MRQAVLDVILGFSLGLAAHAAVGPPPTITVQPKDQTVLKGDNAIFSVEAKSVTKLSYQWYTAATSGGGKKSKISGATNSTYTVVKASKDAIYSAVVANAAGAVSTSNALLTVLAVLAPPLGYNDSYSVLEDSRLNVPLPGVLGNDVGSNLTARLESDVIHGNLKLDADGSFTYVPDLQFNGTDTFSYRPMDGISTGNVATVTISILPVNDPPIALDDATNTVANSPVVIDVLANDSDPDGDELMITNVSTTAGTVVNSGTNILFTPPTDFSGVISFTYSVSDGQLSNSALVTVSVLPRTQPDTYSMDMNAILQVPAPGLLANDLGSAANTLQALLVQNPSNGSVTLNADGSFTYTPSADYVGADSFAYAAYSIVVTGVVTTVSLSIRDTAPLLISSSALTPLGFTLQIIGPRVGNYVVLRSSNLIDWAPIMTNAVTTGALLFTDPDANTQPLGFYRVKVQ